MQNRRHQNHVAVKFSLPVSARAAMVGPLGGRDSVGNGDTDVAPCLLCLRTFSGSTPKRFSYSFGALDGTYFRIAERHRARPASGRVTRALASTFRAPNFFKSLWT